MGILNFRLLSVVTHKSITSCNFLEDLPLQIISLSSLKIELFRFAVPNFYKLIYTTVTQYQYAILQTLVQRSYF